LAVKIDGKWLMLTGDEPFDLESNRMVTLAGGGFDGEKVLRDISEHERLVLNRFHEHGVIEGLMYQGDTLPDGDPRKLWAELEDAPDDDPRFDELPICDPVRLYREDIIDEVFGPETPAAAND
jgi:hypothetical protein